MSAPSIEIFQASGDHLDAMTSLFDGYRQFYGKASDLEACRIFLSARIQNKESVIFMARHFGAAPIGFMQLYPTFSSVSLQHRWILNDLFVSPDGRGAGIGRAMVLKAHEFARDTDAKGLTLQTAKTNTVAQGLYESLGWTQENEFLAYNFRVAT